MPLLLSVLAECILSRTTLCSHQGLERGEETSKHIPKDPEFLFQVSFCMKIHESPEIPKSRYQQASIVEDLHSLDFSP